VLKYRSNRDSVYCSHRANVPLVQITKIIYITTKRTASLIQKVQSSRYRVTSIFHTRVGPMKGHCAYSTAINLRAGCRVVATCSQQPLDKTVLFILHFRRHEMSYLNLWGKSYVALRRSAIVGVYRVNLVVRHRSTCVVVFHVPARNLFSKESATIFFRRAQEW